MDRTQITQLLLFSEDHEKILEGVAWARGKGPDSEFSTQRFLVPRLLGDKVRDEVLKAPLDQSMSDAAFAEGLEASLGRFSHPKVQLIKWWTCLAIIDLGIRSDAALQELTAAAEIALADIVANTEEAFAKGASSEGMQYTFYEFCIVEETLRAVAGFKSLAAVKYLDEVCRGGALKARQPLRRILAMCALGAIGTEDARAALIACRASVEDELAKRADVIIAAFGWYNYDEFAKLASSPATTPPATAPPTTPAQPAAPVLEPAHRQPWQTVAVPPSSRGPAPTAPPATLACIFARGAQLTI